MQRTEENTEQSAEEADGGRGVFLDMGAKRCYDTDKRLNNYLIIGGNMMKESFHKDEPCCVDRDFSFRTMLAMAVATSIDALAIGVSFAFLKVNIWSAVLLIGITTACFSGVGVYVGNLFGNRYKSKAEFAGGFILIAMGLKILLDHTIL